MTAPRRFSSARATAQLAALATLAGFAACGGIAIVGSDLSDAGRAEAAAPPSTTSAGSTPSSSTGAGGFVCSPADGSTYTPIQFSGVVFDPTGDCLVGGQVNLPICGCFGARGLDSSTWCFVNPAGTAYFGISNDQCTVDLPTGWYAQQTFGPSPFGSPTEAQATTCAALLASSTDPKTGSYDRPGPPPCGATDASTCSRPKTCTSAGASCGTIDDGCGHTLDCGQCPVTSTRTTSGRSSTGGSSASSTSSASSRDGGACVLNACTAGPCVERGDGCGGLLECGSCGACQPSTCAALGVSCGGPFADGCGGEVSCGSCEGCTPRTCVSLGVSCGLVSDECGGTLNCGQVCDAGYASACVPTTCQDYPCTCP